jgi:hypothetical protein
LKILIRDRRIEQVSFVPVFFSDRGRPEVQEPGTPLHEEIMSLTERLCAEIGTRVIRNGREASVALEKVQAIDTRNLLKTRKNSYPWLRELAVIIE